MIVIVCTYYFKPMRTAHLLSFLVKSAAVEVRGFFTGRAMAQSKFEYVRGFETEDRLLPNCWIVVRIDGKGFHKFADKHAFAKPNDEKALALMARCARRIFNDYNEVVVAYGESDEFSFVFKKDTELYNRRASKVALLTFYFLTLLVMKSYRLADHDQRGQSVLLQLRLVLAGVLSREEASLSAYFRCQNGALPFRSEPPGLPVVAASRLPHQQLVQHSLLGVGSKGRT
jgi:hypothetical protein